MASFPGILERRSLPELDRPSRPSRRLPARVSAPPPPPPPRRRGLRLLLGLGAGLGLGTLFAVSLAAAAVLHLDAPSARRTLASVASKQGSATLRGRVEILSIDRIGLHAIDLGPVRLFDPAGHAVLAVKGTHLRFSAFGLVRALVSKGTPTIDRVVVDEVAVQLVPDAEGKPTLLEAVRPKEESPPKGPEPSGFRLAIEGIDVRHLAAAGEVSGKRLDVAAELEGASVLVAEDGTTVRVPRLGVVSAPIEGALPASTALEASARVRIPTFLGPGDLPVVAEDVRLHLQSSGAHVELAAAGDERTFTARIMVPELAPGTLARLLGAPPPVTMPLSASIDVRGDREHASVDGSLGVGGASAGVSGFVDLGALEGGGRAELADVTVALRGIEPRAFSPAAPALAVSSDLHAHATRIGQDTEVMLEGRGDLSGSDTTGTLALEGHAALGPRGPIEGSGAARVTIGRSSVDARFVLDATKKGHATVTAHVPAIEELRAFTHVPASGALELAAAADVDLARKTVAGSASLHALGVRHPQARLPEGLLAMQVQGTFVEPVFVAAFSTARLEVSGSTLRDVDVRATGTPKLLGGTVSLTTDRDQRVTLSSHVRKTSNGLDVVGTHASLRRGPFAAELAVADVRLEGKAVTIEGLRLASTAGGLRLDAHYDPRRRSLALRARSTPLDLAQLARGLGADDPAIGGKLALDAELDTAPLPRGHVRVDADEVLLPRLGPLTGHGDVELDDRTVKGDATLRLRDVAELALHASAEAGGRPDDLASWKRAVGTLDLDVPRLDLAKLSALVGSSPLAGTAKLSAHLSRREADGPPSGTLTASTTGFSGAGVEGVDALAKVDLTPNGEKIDTSFALELHDAMGPLAVLGAKTEAAWATLAKIRPADLPLALDLVVLPRDLDRWPRALASKIPLHGTFGLVAKGKGTLGAPKLELLARLDALTALDGSRHDATLRVDLDGDEADVEASVVPRTAPARKELELKGEIHRDGAAKADLRLDRLPLELVAAETGVGGALRGAVHLERAPSAPVKLGGRIDADGLAIGDARFEETFVEVGVDEKSAHATLALHGKDGRLDARLDAPLTLQAGRPVPGAIDAELDAKDLRLRIAEPFVTAVDALDGKLDAHVVAHAKKEANGRWSGSPEGEARVRDAIVVADAVGERWEKVGATLKLSNGHVTLEGVELKGRAGGDAKLNGSLDLVGFTPQKLHAELTTKRFPLASRGAKVGELTSRITVDGKSTPTSDGRERLEIGVSLDDTTLDLSKEVGKKVQGLEQEPSVVVAQPIEAPVEPPGPPGQGTPIQVTVHIPQPIWIRRDDVRIALEGNPRIGVDGPVTVGGEIHIRGNQGSRLQQRSWVEVLGKRFYIQQSKISFEGNQQLDPALDLEVRWQAPDRSIVQIKIGGHLSTPKLEFAALDEGGSPLGLTRGEVMTLLVLGRRDAGNAQQEQQAEKGAARQAASLVAGMTGSILGRQLQNALPTSVNVSVGPGRYSGGVQKDNVYFEVAYNASGAQMGPQAIGQSTPKTTFLVDWRFARKWSLITTLGDTGSALVDLLWHYRY